MNVCPICFSHDIHIFSNLCGHQWCKQCHKKLISYNHTSCVLCRAPIFLKKQLLTQKERIQWNICGGKVVPRWFKKRLSNSNKCYK